MDRTLSHSPSQQTYRFLLNPKILNKKWWKPLFVTSGAWFLFDVAFYGNGVSSFLIIHHILPHASLIQQILLDILIFLLFALPGYIFSALFVDKIGRKKLQSLGFIIMTACYAMMACITDIAKHLPLFIGLFGLSFFFINFGPNATTFLIPAEIFPTRIRAQAHGIATAIGKMGAVTGVCLLPALFSSYHVSLTMGFVAIISFIGALITQLLPEMSRKSLEVTEILLIKNH
jgi:PHS family inorganic phosphate transporter-like MFS transporter